MSDANQPTGQETSEGATPEQAAEPVNAGDLAKALQANRALQAQIAQMQEAQQAAAAKAEQERKAADKAARAKAVKSGDLLQVIRGLESDLAEERERVAALTSELDALKARESERVEAVTAANLKRVEGLPEEFRALIPEGLDPDATARHIERVEGIALKATARPAGGRGGLKSPTPPRAGKWPDEFIAEAKRLAPGMKPETFARTKAGRAFAERRGFTIPTAA